MSRISSFGMYECPRCEQIHIKPEYGSITTYIPLDLHIEDSEIKICQGCRCGILFKDYKYLGLRSKRYTRPPSKFGLWFRKLIKNPYIELDVRKLYPKFD